MFKRENIPPIRYLGLESAVRQLTTVDIYMQMTPLVIKISPVIFECYTDVYLSKGTTINSSVCTNSFPETKHTFVCPHNNKRQKKTETEMHSHFYCQAVCNFIHMKIYTNIIETCILDLKVPPSPFSPKNNTCVHVQ